MKKFLTSFKKWANKIEKRFRLVLSVIILSATMLFSTFFFFDKAIFFLPLLLILSFIATYFSLLEGIEKIGWFGFFFMPVAITLSFYLFYFLFPARWLTRLPFIIIYGVSFYAVLLTANIFNVGVERSLQLYRAAFSVNFFYQAIVAFLLFNLLFSFKQNFIINMLVGGIIGFLLSLHLFWTIRLKKYIEEEVFRFAILIGLILAQLSLITSLVPTKVAISALFLTASYYSLSGLVYHFFDQRLFAETVREYLVVWVFVLLITLLSISW
jgi:hypothetical protein